MLTLSMRTWTSVSTSTTTTSTMWSSVLLLETTNKKKNIDKNRILASDKNIKSCSSTSELYLAHQNYIIFQMIQSIIFILFRFSSSELLRNLQDDSTYKTKTVEVLPSSMLLKEISKVASPSSSSFCFWWHWHLVLCPLHFLLQLTLSIVNYINRVG